MKIANPIHRLLAYLIDKTIYSALFLVLLHFVTFSETLPNLVARTVLAVAVFLSTSLFYQFFSAFMISKFGGNFGKLLTGIKIVDLNGKNLSFWRAFLRTTVGYMVSGVCMFIGYIWILIDKKEHKAWHDMMFETKVIESKPQAFGLALGLVSLVVFGLICSILGINSVGNLVHNTENYQKEIDQQMLEQDLKTVESQSGDDFSLPTEELPSY